MTLIEVLVTIVVGMVVLLGALSMMESGFSSSARVQDRSDAAGRARAGFDRATALLQAQVCNGKTPPVIAGTTTSVTFTANIGDRNATPVQYRLQYLPAAGATPARLAETQWTMSAAPDANGAYTAVTPTTKTVVQYVEPITTGASPSPVFRYWGTDDTTTNDEKELTAPLSSSAAAANYRGRVLRVDIDLRVLPTRTLPTAQAKRLSSRLHASGYVASNLDPTKLDKGPQCT